MADNEPADEPMDDQPGKLPEPKEAGMEKEETGKEPMASTAPADEEE